MWGEGGGREGRWHKLSWMRIYLYKMGIQVNVPSSACVQVSILHRETHSVTKTAVEKLGRGLNIYFTDSSSGSVHNIRSSI